MKKIIAGLLLAVGLAAIASSPALPAASTQTAHAFLCQPLAAGTSGGPQRVVNRSSTATPQPAYSLNSAGCAVIASGDVGYFLSQGFTYGPNIFTLLQTGMTATTTSTTSTITLPASAVIDQIVLTETAGTAVTGGVDIGDSGSATRFASAVALGANATVAVADSALTRVFANGGLPAQDQILIACHTSCVGSSINITIIYSYF